MNLSFYIAKRYLFSKKSHNAINLISMVAVCGVAVATLAMVCTMSVFNGFQDLVSSMFCSFDPELKIYPAKGKVFDAKSEEILSIEKIPEIAFFSEVLEDNVIVRYKDRQVPAVLKGVTDNFAQLTRIEDTLIDGDFKLSDDVNNFATLGVGLAYKLGTSARFVYPLEVFVPKRNVPVNLSNPATSISQEYVYITSVFSINQPSYDDNLMIVSLDLARTLFDYETEVSALEIKLKDGAKVSSVQKQIEKLLGEAYVVKNQYQQQEASFRMMNIEKWMTFLILCFILVIAVFNVIGSLSMLMIEKQKDVMTLRNMGADDRLISRIFLFEGWMISVMGAIAGITLGLLLCLAQQQFGLLKMGDVAGTFIVDSYPVKVIPTDSVYVFITVLVIGFLAASYPVRYLSRKWLK